MTTLLIGFSVAKAVAGFAGFESLQRIDPPPIPVPGVSEEGSLAIEYVWTEPIPDGYQAVFKVSNFGAETIRFPEAPYACRLHEGKGPRTFRMGSVGCSLDVDFLMPYQSTTAYVSVDKDDRAYFLTFDYYEESSTAKRRAWLHVEQPHDSDMPPR
jgi:hypothetical protein